LTAHFKAAGVSDMLFGIDYSLLQPFAIIDYGRPFFITLCSEANFMVEALAGPMAVLFQ
jgi:hypothetical protein